MTPSPQTAAEAAALWGGCAELPRLVAHRENAIFEARLVRGERVALRFHRPGYLDAAAIETELGWTEALAEKGISCPRPLRCRAGRLVATCDNQVVSVVQWIDAPPMADETQAPDVLYHRLGATLAGMHSAADRLGLCPVPRHTWKMDDLIGKSPRWGGFWRNPALKESECAFLIEARDTARVQVSGIPHPDVGLIHADVLRENVLDDGEHLWLIDFDDSGWGYRGYDLATTLIQHLDAQDFDTRLRALMQGYLSQRPHAGGLTAQLPLFLLMRGLATAGWIVPRAPDGDRRQRIYAERALSAARYYLSVQSRTNT